MNQITDELDHLGLDDTHIYQDVSEFRVPLHVRCNALLNDSRISRLVKYFSAIDCQSLNSTENLLDQMTLVSDGTKQSSYDGIKCSDSRLFNSIVDMSREHNVLSHQCGRYLLLMTSDLLLAFDNFETCAIYIHGLYECILFEQIDMNELNLILSTISELKQISSLLFPNRLKDERHSILFASKIFSKIRECLGLKGYLDGSRTIQATFSSSFFLSWWGRFAVTMPAIPYMSIGCYIERNFLCHENLLLSISRKRQLVMSEIRTLSVKRFPTRMNGLLKKYQFDLLLRIPISTVYSTERSVVSYHGKSKDEAELDHCTSAMMSLASELQLKILNDDLGFPDCSCIDHRSYIKQLEKEKFTVKRILTRIADRKVLYPMMKRVFRSPSGQPFSEIYCILITGGTLGGGFDPTWTKSFSSVSHASMEKLLSIDTLDRHHFTGEVIDINSESPLQDLDHTGYVNQSVLDHVCDSEQLSDEAPIDANKFITINICDIDDYNILI